MKECCFWKVRRDESERYEIDLFLTDESPKKDCIIDMTPRRTQKFKPEAGDLIEWENYSINRREKVQYGSARVDSWGLTTIERLEVGSAGNRIIVYKKH